MNIKDINIWTILSLLLIIVGLSFYIYWGIRYGVWADEGIYSITIFLVFPGVIGAILSLLKEKEE